MARAVALGANFMDLPGVKDAYDFIRGQWDKWKGIPTRITAAVAKADELTQLAKQQNKPQVATVTGEALGALTSLKNFWDSANAKLDAAMADLRSMGFGIVPLIVAAAVIAAAGAFYYVFRQMEYYERVLSDVEAGVLTGEQGQNILGGGDGVEQTFTGEIGHAVGKVLIGAVVIGGGYLLVTRVAIPKFRKHYARRNPRRR